MGSEAGRGRMWKRQRPGRMLLLCYGKIGLKVLDGLLSPDSFAGVALSTPCRFKWRPLEVGAIGCDNLKNQIVKIMRWHLQDAVLLQFTKCNRLGRFALGVRKWLRYYYIHKLLAERAALVFPEIDRRAGPFPTLRSTNSSL